MPRETLKVERVISYLKSHKKQVVIGALLFGAIIYAILFFIPKPVQFSYAGATCVRQVTLFPGLHKGMTNSYDVTFEDQWRVGFVALSSFKTCFTSKKEPRTGTEVVSTAPLGGIVARKHFAITVPDQPLAQLSSLQGKAIPSTKPLRIPLSTEDMVFSYTLRVDQKQVECRGDGAALICNIAKLELAQGSNYNYVLSKKFNNTKPVTIGSGKLETLKATNIIESSVKPGQTIYDKPQTLSFTTDKPLEKAKVSLMQENKPVAFTQTIEGTTITLALKEPLARQKTSSVARDGLEAADKSTLAEPFKMNFATSGGPKVADVSVGASGVAQSATIIITFDQNISKTKDFLQFVKVAGVPASIKKQSDNQVAIQLGNAPLCQAFSITVAKDAPSEHDILTTEPWVFSSRVTCQSVIRYGTSVQGRPLMAYAYGTGTKRVLFTGGIHGNERSTVTTMQAWNEYLNANAHTLPANTQVIVAPNLNPDGIAIGKRYNANNVNLGRNFPARNWAPDATTANGNEKGVGGSSPGSEPETKALMSLTSQYRPRLIVSVHSQGRLVGANKYGDSVSIGNTYANMVGYRTMYDNAEDVMGYSITGEYEEWVGEVYGTPAILIELPSHFGNYFVSQQKALLYTVGV